MQISSPLARHSAPGRRHRLEEERTFQLLFLLSFPIFLALALTARAHPASRSGDEAGQHRGSVLAEAAAAARSTIAIALTD